MTDIHYTPSQLKLMEILADGQNHHENVLIAALDSQAERNGLRVHISNIRKLILPHGYDIVFRYKYYRLVTLLKNPLNLSPRQSC